VTVARGFNTFMLHHGVSKLTPGNQTQDYCCPSISAAFYWEVFAPKFIVKWMSGEMHKSGCNKPEV
jgi:hypothetical protein